MATNALVAALAVVAALAAAAVAEEAGGFVWTSEAVASAPGPKRAPLPAWLKKRLARPGRPAARAPSVLYAEGGADLDAEVAAVTKSNARYLAGEESARDIPSPADARAAGAKMLAAAASEGSAASSGEGSAAEESKRDAEELAEIATREEFSDAAKQPSWRPDHLPAGLQHLANGIPDPWQRAGPAPSGPGMYYNSVNNVHAVARGLALHLAPPPVRGGGGGFGYGSAFVDDRFFDVFDTDGGDPASGAADPNDPAKAEPTEEA